MRAESYQPEMRSAHEAASNATADDKTFHLTFAVQPERIARALMLLVLLIVIAGTIANLVIYEVAPSPDHALAKFMQRFDLGHEPSIPNWYSSLALLVASALLAVVASTRESVAAGHRSRWLVLSVLFLFLAIDEAVLIHEMVDTFLHRQLDTGGIFYFAWVIPYSALVLLLAAYYMPFVLRLEKRTRRLFVTSAILFVAGAVGLELIQGVIVDEHGVEGGFISKKLTVALVIEEALEMFAVVLFIYALLDYLRRSTTDEVVVGRVKAPHETENTRYRASVVKGDR